LSIACSLRIIFVVLPVNHRRLRRNIVVTTARLVACLSLLGLPFVAGCKTTVETEHTSDQSLRSRKVKGSSTEVFDLVARCIRQGFPNGLIFSDAKVGQISVTDYLLMHGDAAMEVTVTGRPNGMVDVRATATGLGADRTRVLIERFLHDFDQAYDIWADDHVNPR
jgi:hypothetical protein